MYSNPKKDQINFRIDRQILREIKAAARKEGIPYTKWILDRCREALSADPSRPTPGGSLENLPGFQELVKRVERLEKAIELDPTVTEKKEPDDPARADPVGLTNSQLAGLLNVNRSTVSRWANGKRQVPENLGYSFDPSTKKWRSSADVPRY
jgi:hypothetical protein